MPSITLLDILKTNFTILKPEDLSWTNRKSVSYYSQGHGPRRTGTAYEYMIELSNILGASPWICVPHAASDAYVRNLATLLRDTLRPDLRVHAF